MVSESEKKRAAEILRMVADDIEAFGSDVENKKAYAAINFIFQVQRLLADMAEK